MREPFQVLHIHTPPYIAEKVCSSFLINSTALWEMKYSLFSNDNENRHLFEQKISKKKKKEKEKGKEVMKTDNKD